MSARPLGSGARARYPRGMGHEPRRQVSLAVAVAVALAVAVAVAVTAGCGRDTGGPPHDPGDVDAAMVSPPPPPVDDYIESRTEGLPGRPRVLIYTFQSVWHHPSMIDLRQAILDMNESRGFTVLTTNHPLAITASNLAKVDVIVFAVTSGHGMTEPGKAALEAWIRAGGGVVGFHSATFTEPFFPFYVANIGTSFAGHPPGFWPATLRLSRTHPITAGLGDLPLTDEWYFFSQRPETIPGAEMLIALDEDTLPADYPAVN